MQISLADWEGFLKHHHPNVHLLQTGRWGELKSVFGWKPIRVKSGTSGAQLLFHQLPGGLSIGYLPKGPLGNESDLLDEIDQVCRENRAIFLKIEPDLDLTHHSNYQPTGTGWIPSKPIQPRRTVIISLQGSEEDLLNRMKQKTRYNIRLAEKKEVVVVPSTGVAEFYSLARSTAARDAFGVHSLAYYERAYRFFHEIGACELLTAYYHDQALASIFVFASGISAYYLYGASSDLERNRMPAYLVQWEAMKWARRKGCLTYDLWGIPDLDEEELEAEFQRRQAHDGLWGVYRFKRGFGGEVMRSVGAWDRIYHPMLYRIYTGLNQLRDSGRD